MLLVVIVFIIIGVLVVVIVSVSGGNSYFQRALIFVDYVTTEATKPSNQPSIPSPVHTLRHTNPPITLPHHLS